MLERFLEKTEFDSLEDFQKNYKIKPQENFNFAYDVIDAWAAEAPNKKAMLWTDDSGLVREYTFRDLSILSDRTAAFFMQLGIGRGDRVMLLLKRHAEFWFSLLALHKIGAIAIPATHMLMTKDLVYRNNAAGVKMIVAANDPKLKNQIEGSLQGSPTLKTLVTTGDEENSMWHSFNLGIASAPEFRMPERPTSNNDVMLIYFTSGSAGQPKMVAHNYLYPLGHIVTARFWHQLGPDSLHITVADTGWAKAAWGKIYGQWIVGACQFIYDQEKFNAADMLDRLARHHVTSFCAPPTIYRFLIREDLSKYDLSSLRSCATAGEPFNPSVSDEWFKATGIRVMEGFGQTETTLTVGNFVWMKHKPGSMGLPNPAYDIDVVDSEGNSTAPGEDGELIIRLDRQRPIGLFEEYYNTPALTEAAFAGGVYHTGDRIRRDEDGYFWFIGRTDDVIKSSGYRISPFEVESALMTHPAVVECAITGVPDEVRGQVVKASIILAPEFRGRDLDVLRKEIQDHVKRVSAPYKYPRIVDFVDSLPKTISGKIQRKKIRETDERQSER